MTANFGGKRGGERDETTGGGVASVGHSFINTLQRVSETNEVAGILRRVAAVVGIPRRRRIDDRTTGDTATRPLRRPEGKRRLERRRDGMPYYVYLWPTSTKRGKGVEGRVLFTAMAKRFKLLLCIKLQTDMHELCLHLEYYMIGNSGLNRAHHYTTYYERAMLRCWREGERESRSATSGGRNRCD